MYGIIKAGAERRHKEYVKWLAGLSAEEKDEILVKQAERDRVAMKVLNFVFWGGAAGVLGLFGVALFQHFKLT